MLGLLSEPQAAEEGLLGRERLGRVPYGYTASGRACSRSPWGVGWLSTRLCLKRSTRSLTARLGSRLWSRLWLVRWLLDWRCLGWLPLLRRHYLLLLRLRRRGLLLLDRGRTRGPDRTGGGRRLWAGLFALTVWAHRLIALDLGGGGVIGRGVIRGRGIVGSAGCRPVLGPVPGLILKTGSDGTLWTWRTGALGSTLTLFGAHLDAGG